MSELTHLSLFSGIGGLDLAAERAGFRTVGQCEWADYPHAVLQKHWPDVPKWRDIRTLTKEGFRERTGLDTVTVVSGGFPCQPFSTAGKRRGKEDDRYLWPEMCRVISEIRPTWVVGENVAGLISMDLDTVLSDLEGIGYTCQTLVIPACAVDAPHRRDRCAILAHANRPGQQRCQQHGAPGDRQSYGSVGQCCPAVADTDGDGCARFGIQPSPGCNSYTEHFVITKSSTISNTDGEGFQIAGHQPGEQSSQRKNGTADGHRWPAEPNVGRVAHGVPARVDRLRCLGNAVVPQQFRPIFRAIADIERSFT